MFIVLMLSLNTCYTINARECILALHVKICTIGTTTAVVSCMLTMRKWVDKFSEY